MKTIAEILEHAPRYFPGSDVPADLVGKAYNLMLDSLEAMQAKPDLRHNHHEIVRSMLNYGGSFVNAFARAWQAADMENKERLQAAFPDLFERYDAFPTLGAREASLS